MGEFVDYVRRGREAYDLGRFAFRSARYVGRAARRYFDPPKVTPEKRRRVAVEEEPTRETRTMGLNRGHNAHGQSTSRHLVRGHAIPRNIFKEHVGLPRSRVIENGQFAILSASNNWSQREVAFLKGDRLQALESNLNNLRLTQVNPGNAAQIPGLAAGAQDNTSLGLQAILWSCKEQFQIANLSNVGGYVEIIDYVARCTENGLANPTEGASINLTPFTAWEAGIADKADIKQNLDAAALQAFMNQVGSRIHHGQPEIRRNFKIERVHRIHLAPGEQHVHTVVRKMNKFLNLARIRQSSVSWSSSTTYHKGISHGTWFRWHGDIGIDNSGSRNACWCPMELAAVWSNEFVYTPVILNMGFLQGLTSLTAGVAVTTGTTNPDTGLAGQTFTSA